MSRQPSPGFYPEYPHWCHSRKIPSLWTSFENSNSYQQLWNGKKVYLLNKTSIGWTIWVPKVQMEFLQWLTTHLFLLLQWRWKLYTKYWGLLCAPLDYMGTKVLSTSYMKIVICNENHFINARDKFTTFSKGFVKNWRYNIKFLITQNFISFHRKVLKCPFWRLDTFLLLIMEYLFAFVYILKQRTLSEPSKGKLILAWLTSKITWVHINEVNHSL